MKPEIAEQLEIDAQYTGYLERQDADILAFHRDEARTLPASLDYGRSTAFPPKYAKNWPLSAPPHWARRPASKA